VVVKKIGFSPTDIPQRVKTLPTKPFTRSFSEEFYEDVYQYYDDLKKYWKTFRTPASNQAILESK